MPGAHNGSRLLTLSAAALLMSATALTQAAEEWPRWLGPRGDNIVRDAGLPDQWPAGGPKRVWEKNVGAGFSSPIGFDGKVYVFSLEGGDKEVLTAFDAATGNAAWSQGYDRPTPGGERPDPTWFSDSDQIGSQPLVYRGKVFVKGKDKLVGLDLGK